jgi:hypothetical protein
MNMTSQKSRSTSTQFGVRLLVARIAERNVPMNLMLFGCRPYSFLGFVLNRCFLPLNDLEIEQRSNALPVISPKLPNRLIAVAPFGREILLHCCCSKAPKTSLRPSRSTRWPHRQPGSPPALRAASSHTVRPGKRSHKSALNGRFCQAFTSSSTASATSEITAGLTSTP